MADVVISRRPWWRRLQWKRAAVSMLAAACLVGIGYAFTLNETPRTTLDADGAIEAVTPGPGALEQSQTAVKVLFRFGWTGELEINGTPIPDDELIRRETTGVELTFQPGPDRVFSRLEGSQVVTVRYWRIEESREQARAYTWQFRTL